MIDFGDLPLLELEIEQAMGIRRACQHQHAASLPVEPVHDPQPPERLLQQTDNIGRIGLVAVGQGRQPGGLVHDQQRLIDMQHPVTRFERHIARLHCLGLLVQHLGVVFRELDRHIRGQRQPRLDLDRLDDPGGHRTGRVGETLRRHLQRIGPPRRQ